MDLSTIAQGSFTQGATAVAQTLVIPSSLDSMEIWNYTQAGATGGNAFRLYWQRANGANIMGDGTQGIYMATGDDSAVTAGQTASGAFVLYDPTNIQPGASIALTGFTAANPGVVTTGSTAGISAGSVVRFTSLNNQSYLNGMEFSVGYGTLTGTTFSVDYLNTTGSTASTSGNWTLIPYQPLFYPRSRLITNITAAAQAVVTLSVDHGFTVGQSIRMSLVGGSSVWGNFAQLNNNAYTIVAVDTAVGNGHNTITLNVNTIGFGTFITVWQAITGAYSKAQVNPIGEDSAASLASLSAQVPVVNGVQIYDTNSGVIADSRVNTGFLGMTLAAGALLPAGVAADVIFWKAYKANSGGL